VVRKCVERGKYNSNPSVFFILMTLEDVHFSLSIILKIVIPQIIDVIRITHTSIYIKIKLKLLLEQQQFKNRCIQILFLVIQSVVRIELFLLTSTPSIFYYIFIIFDYLYSLKYLFKYKIL
jgi:hypothetical protein